MLALFSIRAFAAWIAECLIPRRDKIGRAYFRKVLPIDKFEMREGNLGFEDLAEKAGYRAAGPFTIAWLRFDNASGTATPIEGAEGSAIPAGAGPYVVARIAGADRPRQTVDVTLRRDGDSTPVIVGIDRRW